MKLALYLPNFRDHVTVQGARRPHRLAEELDFDSVWTLDRIVVPEASDRQELQYPFGMMEQFPKQLPVVGAWPVAAGLAAHPVARRQDHEAAHRHEHHRHAVPCPGRARRRVATVDQLSGGRVNVGVGSGWMPEEFAAASAAHIFPKRHKHVRETIEIMQGHLDQRDCSSTTASSPTSTASGFGAKPGAEAAPADLLQRPEGPEALREPDREVRPVGVDRHPGHAATSSPSGARDPGELDELGSRPIAGRPRHVQHDLVRHHRRADRPDDERQGVSNLLVGTAIRSPTCSSATRRPD
jgi:alkanesulfonate monooxygenase SsuD/methylene tetrahydromethanopterin reductase-like flavin-dependent oxidoreductase (luciferase family)